MANKKSGKKKDEKKSKTTDTVAAKQQEEGEESAPLLVRLLIIGSTSFLAQKIWTAKSVVSDVWYYEGQSDLERKMVTVFEFLGAMGAMFIVGIVVGLTITKVSDLFTKWKTK